VGSPIPPSQVQPVLLVALQTLTQALPSGRLPDVQPGQAFWAKARDVNWLVQDGYAEYPPENTPVPPSEPRLTAHGSPGAGAGTSNASF